jgi:hypothetical protein
MEGKKWLIYLLLGGGLAWFVQYSNDEAKKEDGARQTYLKEHPTTQKQAAADAHFSKCSRYRATPTSVWSDNQRNMMLGAEGCYSDDRDDPQYLDATYPWNASAPQPWKAAH